MASVGVGHGEPGQHGGPHGSSLGLGPCLGGLALMEALGEAVFVKASAWWLHMGHL